MTGAVGRAFPNCQRDRLAETPRFRRLSFRQDPDAHLRGAPDSHLHRFWRSRYPVGAVKHRDGLLPQRRACAKLFQPGPPDQRAAHGKDAVTDIVMHTQLHGKGLFLPDDLRHLLKQPSHPLICLRQLCAFLLQMLLPPHKLRDIRGGDLRISKPCRCFDAFLRKAQLRAVGKPENIKLRIQTANGWRR